MSDELESEYITSIEQSQEADIDDWAASRVKSYEARQRVKSAPAPAETPAGPLGWREQMVAEMSGQGEAGADFKRVGRIGDAAGRVAVDVAHGAHEAPIKGVGGGIADFGKDILGQAGDLTDWWNESHGDLLNETFDQPGAFENKKAWKKRRSQLEKNLFDRTAELIPDVDQPKSNTGKFIRGWSKWMTAFVPLLGPASRGAAAAGLVGRGAQIGSAAAAGFGADLMMSAEANLSNMIQDTPLANPVNEFLSLQEDDSEVTKRLKTAIEGMGLGLLTDSLVHGLRVMRSARKARAAADAVTTGKEVGPKSFLDSLKEVVGEATDEDMAKAFGVDSIDEPMISVDRQLQKVSDRVGDMTPDEMAARAAAETRPDIYWNASRVNSSDDVDEILKKAMGADYDALQKARRLGRSLDTVAEEAADEGISLREILHRKEGDPLSDVKSKAARDLMQSATDKLLVLERAAQNGGSAELYAYRKMVVIHQAMLEKLLGARADASRSLGSWRLDAEGSVERAFQIQELLEANGGEAFTRKMAKKLSGISDLSLRAKAQRKIMERPTLNTLREIGTLGLLWSPKTHMTNMMSNSAVAVAEPVERAVAARYGRLIGLSVGERVEVGEATAMAFGELSAIKAAFKASWRRARTGESTMEGIAGSKLDFHHPVITAETYGLKTGTGFARAVDFIGKVNRSPGTALMAEDEWFKTIGYWGEVSALSVRKANIEGSAAGWSRARIKQRAAEIAMDPPSDIRLEAVDAARYKTFTRAVDGRIAKLAKDLQRLPLGYAVLPFVNTPANIFSYMFERVPGLSYLSKSWREDIAAGGARGNLALARTATGAAVLATAFDLAHDGLITGSGPESKALKERMQGKGWAQNSVYSGSDDTYYSWNRFDQYAAPLALAAELNSVWDQYDIDDEDMNSFRELVAAGSLAFAHAMTDRSWTKGISDVFEMIEEPDRNLEWYTQQRVQQHVPFSSAFRTAEQIVDPELSSASGFFFEPIMALIPGLASKLPRKRNLWGESIEPDPEFSSVRHATSPIAVSTERGHPIDDEMVRLGFGVGRITKKTEFDGVDANFHEYPRAYEEYQDLAGQDSLEKLNEMVTGKGDLGSFYRDPMMNDANREKIIRKTISDARKQAQRTLLDDPEHIDFKHYVDRLKAKKNAHLFEGYDIYTGEGALQ